MKTSLLQSEKAHIKGCWLLSRALESRRISLFIALERRLIISFMVVMKSGHTFLPTVNIEGFTKSKSYISEKLMKNIIKVGHQTRQYHN